MSLSSIELWQRIAAEGLASPMQCRTWAAEAAQSLPAADTTDGIKVLQQLIEIGRLTNYQAKILAGQSDRPLKRGAWHILRHVKLSPWNGWLEVTKIDTTKAEWSPPRWSTWLTSTQLKQLENSAPCLPRGIQLAGIRHTNLQAISIPELDNGELHLQVAPVAGSSLGPGVASKLDVPAIQTLIRQIVDAAGTLHAADITHGRIFPDRVFWDGSNAVLIVDPIASLTATLDASANGLLGQDLSGLNPIAFLAPEFIAPGQQPNASTDVFALGCLWWWLLTGQPSASGADAQTVLANHAQPLPSLPAEIRLQAPMLRVLQHSLARNPSTRFASAHQMGAAMDAADAMIRKGKIPRRTRSTPTPTPEKTTLQATLAQATPEVAYQSNSSESTSKNPRESASGKSGSGPSTPESNLRGNTDTPEKPTARTPKPENPQHSKKKPTTSTPKQVAIQADSATIAAEVTASAVPERSGSSSEKHPKPRAKTSATVPNHPNPNAPNDSDETSTAARAPSLTPVSHVAPQRAADRPLKTRGGTPRASAQRKKRRRRAGNKWMLPVMGGCGFLILLLLILKLSGALDPKPPEPRAGRPGPTISKPIRPNELPATDPLLDVYRIVDADDRQLWAPPAPPDPFGLEMLPPGGQCFLSIRPAEMLASETKRKLLSTFDPHLTRLLDRFILRTGCRLEQIQQATLAFYAPAASGGPPQTAVRIQMLSGMPLTQLKSAWNAPSAMNIGKHSLLATPSGDGIYIPEQPLVDAQNVNAFSVGPVELMREVAELEGAGGPLISQMETLWEASDMNADFSLLVSPPFLFTDGQRMLAAAPVRLQKLLTELLRKEARAGLVQMRFEPNWYFEIQLIGSSPPETARIAAAVESKLSSLPDMMLSWFLEESPHGYWRELAVRYPQMLRKMNEFSRISVENGVAITNGYLPSDAAQNVLLSSWIALQDGATLIGQTAPADDPRQQERALTIEQYLARPIRVSFEQEPIEVALQIIAEEANDQLPAGTPQLRFDLDGDAFEKSGITRNQQLQNFVNDRQPVRHALTMVAKQGNPVATVQDTREKDQKLIWVVQDDPNSPGRKMVSLTTRVAAEAAEIELPVEFASN